MRLAKGFFLPFWSRKWLNFIAVRPPSGNGGATEEQRRSNGQGFPGAVFLSKIISNYFNRREKLMFVIG